MNKMGLVAVGPKPNLSKPQDGARIYPVFAAGMQADVRQRRLVRRYNLPAYGAWISVSGCRYGLAQSICAELGLIQHVGSLLLSRSPGGGVDAVRAAFDLQHRPGRAIYLPGVYCAIRGHKVEISMDGVGRATDNAFIERLWRSLKYECVYLHAFEDGVQLYQALAKYFQFYNYHRPHQGLKYRDTAPRFLKNELAGERKKIS